MPDSIVRIALDGWRLGMRSIIEMPRLSGTAFLLILGCDALEGYFDPMPPADAMPTLYSVVFSTIQLIVDNCIFASVLIAVHRIVLLSEVADRPIWKVPRTFSRFVGWLLFLNLLGIVTSFANWWASQTLLIPAVVGGILCVVVSIVVSLRLMMLFPAIALAIPSANWRNAWADSRGHAWNFLGTQLAVTLPLVALVPIFVDSHGLRKPEGWWVLLNALTTLLWCYAEGAAVSRLLWNYGAALVRPDSPPAIPRSD